MFSRILAIIAIVLLPVLALAQSNVTTNPLPVYSANASSTITQTDTFQQVFANVANPTQGRRNGCTIQNTGSHTMYVYVHQGSGGTADKTKSYQIIPPTAGVQGGTFNCITGSGAVIQDQIDITGTATETFTATSQ